MTNKQTKLRREILSAFAILLITIVVITPITTLKAQTQDSPIPTNAYMTVSPNPVGVGQQVAIHMWLVQINPTSKLTHAGAWGNYTLLITKPDGTTETKGPFTAADTSAVDIVYTPQTIGNYTLKFTFPGQHVTGISAATGTAVDAYYGASSYTLTLTVQEQPVQETPNVALPTEYWTRPINSQNRLWYSISGNWLGTSGSQGGPQNTYYNNTGNFNPYTTVPNTAHIVWTKSLIYGGLIGGEFGDTATSMYYTGKSYEGVLTPPVIINGVLYYNTPVTPKNGFYAVDLRTGETLWYQNNTVGITNGQILNFLTPNQVGGMPYLWFMRGTTYYMYDANTGNLILKISNGYSVGQNSGATCSEGSNGELLVYVLGNNWLAMWNSTLCLLPSMADPLRWRPAAGTYDFKNGVQWNVTVTTYPGETIWQVGSGVVLATTGSLMAPQDWQMEVGYDATTGAQLWVQNRTTPAGNTAYGLMGTIGDGIYTEFHKDTMQWYGYSVQTGKQVWGPSEEYTEAWGSMPNNSGLFAQVAYGILYAQSVDGIHALNNTNGQTLWTFYADNSGADFPGFTTYPFETNGLYTVADGKLIAATGDSHGVPEYRNASLYVIDTYTGEKVWSVNGYYQGIMPVADGYLVAFNSYDGQLYSFGKGSTDTTVQTPLAGVTEGQSFTVQGSVMDTSAGASQTAVKANFPKGLPAVSDDSQTAWMEYVYMQQELSANVTGVDVSIDAIDPNGNFVHLGDAASDASGFYSFQVNPSMLSAGAGTYKVIATFAGSESYWLSEAESSFTVNSAPTVTPAATAQANLATSTDLMMYIAAAVTAIIVAIAIATVLMLRKHP